MNKVARLFYKSIYRAVIHLKKSATLAIVYQKSARFYGYNRAVSAGYFKAVGLLISFYVAVFAAAA